MRLLLDQNLSPGLAHADLLFLTQATTLTMAHSPVPTAAAIPRAVGDAAARTAAPERALRGLTRTIE